MENKPEIFDMKAVFIFILFLLFVIFAWRSEKFNIDNKLRVERCESRFYIGAEEYFPDDYKRPAIGVK